IQIHINIKQWLNHYKTDFWQVNYCVEYLLILVIQTVLTDPICVYDIGDGLKFDLRTLGFAHGKGPKYDRISSINPTTKHLVVMDVIHIRNLLMTIVQMLQHVMVGLFWTLFSFVYLINRLIIRLLSNLKCFHRNTQSATTTKSKFSQAFVISLNQYGSTRPIQSIYRSDSLFSNGDLTLDNERISAISNYGKINLTINHYSAMIDNCQQPKTCLLKHYLKTYNPLEIDLIEANPETIRTSKVTEISGDDRSSDTSTLPADNCYSMNCTNKQKIHQSKRYVRLKEQENCSANVSIIDDQPSSCSTRLTSSVLPVVMVTDCSNSQRLHTDIIEMNENE
ncbi:unnamed protein product, partial [Rotaria magnacalcarata]